MPGFRRYADPANLLIPTERWPAPCDDFCALTGTDPDPRRQLGRVTSQRHAALEALETVLADADDQGQLVVSPLTAEQLPAEALALQDAAAALLPTGDLPAVLIEVDRETGFTDTLTPAGGTLPRGPDLRRNLYATVLAYACNLGPAAMAQASGIGEDTLAGNSGTCASRPCGRRTPGSSTPTTATRWPGPGAAARCPPPTGSGSRSADAA